MDGIEVVMDVLFELVVCVINYMIYLYIGDFFYFSVFGQMKIMIDNLCVNYVLVCWKCDLSSMFLEEFWEFVSLFIYIEDGRDGIMKVYEEYLGVVLKMLEVFMNESIVGRMYFFEMKNFVLRESFLEECFKFKEYVLVVDKEIEFKEDKGKGKEEKEGELFKENISLLEKMDGMRLGELKEFSGKIKVESKLIWQVF